MQKKMKEWDEGSISAFISKQDIESFSIDIGNHRTLILTIEKSKHPMISNIAIECAHLLTWLGVKSTFTVYLWWIDLPRVIDWNEWPAKESINGGWTKPGADEICIYRAEEWDRVLIHETIHALEWDWSMPDKPLPCWNFLETDVVYPHLFEAWTELYAEWLWCGWHNQSWIKQRKWQTMQALQVLARRPSGWKEDTNIFAYYVLKTCLAPHIEFLWSSGNGNTQEEFSHIMCELVQPQLQALKIAAKSVTPVQVSMRMTQKLKSEDR